MKDFRTLLILFLIVLLLCSLGVIGYLYSNTEFETVVIPVPQVTSTPTPVPTPKQEENQPDLTRMDIHLYFLTPNHRQLAVENREITSTHSITERIRQAVENLLEGPISRELINPIPKEAELQSVFWDEKEGRVYVSFTPSLLDNPTGHSLSEWATIYSIVNTVAAQSSAIKDVQLLVDGQEVQSQQTLWDWSLPFEPDTTFVRYSGSEEER